MVLKKYAVGRAKNWASKLLAKIGVGYDEKRADAVLAKCSGV